MMRNIASREGTLVSHFGCVARAIVEDVAKAARDLAGLRKGFAAHERDLRQLDARMLQDIGLEPFDVYYGWRSSGH